MKDGRTPEIDFLISVPCWPFCFWWQYARVTIDPLRIATYYLRHRNMPKLSS
jgi:hypothetical protein